jgi:hypothetical protein
VKRGHGSKMGRKMEEAIAALLSERTMQDAARVAGISISALLRWQKDPEFDAAYREARRAGMAQSTARFQQCSGAAATVILKMTLDPTTPPATRLRAAEIVLNQGILGVERDDMMVRITQLERAQQQSTSSDPEDTTIKRENRRRGGETDRSS